MAPEDAMPPVNVVILSVVVFCVGVSCIVIANFIFYTILGEVNGKRGQANQIAMLFVNVRSFEVVRLHKEFFPKSQKRTAMYIVAFVGFALCLGTLASNLRVGPTR
jgi:hypothetical protein